MELDFKNRNTKTKKEMVRFIRELHKRFMKMDFLVYTEEPHKPNKFKIDTKTKEEFKTLLFKYKNKITINYNLNKLEYATWRANFPIQK